MIKNKKDKPTVSPMKDFNNTTLPEAKVCVPITKLEVNHSLAEVRQVVEKLNEVIDKVNKC